jgi:hypothetical protein
VNIIYFGTTGWDWAVRTAVNKNLYTFLRAVLFLLLSSNLLYVISGALHFPMSHIDVWSSWLYKAKALYLFKGSLDFLFTAHNQFNHPQYPLLFPLFVAGLYTLWGSVNELVISLFSPVVYGVILILCYQFLLKLKFTPVTALAGTYAYSMIPPLLAQAGRYHAAMPDIYLTLLYWLALHLVFDGQQSLKKAFRNTFIFLVIVASLIKVEGVFMIFYLFFLPLTWKQKWYAAALASLGFVAWEAIVFLGPIYQSYGLSLSNFWIIHVRLPILAKETIQELFFNISNWYCIWWLFFITLIFIRPQHIFQRTIARPLLQLFFWTFLIIYVFNTTPVVGYISSSLDRLLLQISPLWFCVLLLNLSDAYNLSGLHLESLLYSRYNHALFQKKNVSILKKYKEHHGSTSKEQNHPR